MDNRIRFLECEWKVKFKDELWTEIVRGVSKMHGASDAKNNTKTKKATTKKEKTKNKEKSDADKSDEVLDNYDDDEDHDDDDSDDDEGEDNGMRPVDSKEDADYGTVFKKLFGTLKNSFIAATKEIAIPHYDEKQTSLVSLESRMQSEWDMESIVGVNIWGRGEIPVYVSANMSQESKNKTMNKKSASDDNVSNADDDDDDESDSDYILSYKDSDDDNDDDVLEEGDDYVASQCFVEHDALATPLWINEKGFIRSKMMSKTSD